MGFPTRAGTRVTGNDNVDRLFKQLESIFYSNAGGKKPGGSGFISLSCF